MNKQDSTLDVYLKFFCPKCGKKVRVTDPGRAHSNKRAPWWALLTKDLVHGSECGGVLLESKVVEIGMTSWESEDE